MKKNSINNSIFVGSFVSKDYSLAYKLISQAGNNFQHCLVELLNWNLCYSFCPIFIDSNYNDKNTDYIKQYMFNTQIVREYYSDISLEHKITKLINHEKN